MSGWYLKAGRERDHRFAIIEDDGVTWTQVRDIATRFDSKALAAVEQMEIVAALGIQVAVVSDCPKARQQDDAIAMMRAGPGPHRPAVHGETVFYNDCGDRVMIRGAVGSADVSRRRVVLVADEVDGYPAADHEGEIA